jgi:hypothetical protein
LQRSVASYEVRPLWPTGAGFYVFSPPCIIRKGVMPYFYQHSEGSIIEKPAVVVHAAGGPGDYFTGPFVKAWWFESDLLRPCRTAAPPEPRAGQSMAPAV